MHVLFLSHRKSFWVVEHDKTPTTRNPVFGKFCLCTGFDSLSSYFWCTFDIFSQVTTFTPTCNLLRFRGCLVLRMKVYPITNHECGVFALYNAIIRCLARGLGTLYITFQDFLLKSWHVLIFQRTIYEEIFLETHFDSSNPNFLETRFWNFSWNSFRKSPDWDWNRLFFQLKMS